MPSPPRADRRKLGARPPRIVDAPFVASTFFDPSDVVQVKYEILRRHRVDGLSVTEIAIRYGISRQTFYTIARAFAERGLAGLLPAKSGPRGGWKCTSEVLQFARARRRRKPSLPLRELAVEIARDMRVDLHPNTLKSALAKRA